MGLMKTLLVGLFIYLFINIIYTEIPVQHSWFKWRSVFYPSQDALQVELLHPFAHHLQHRRNNSQRYWPKNVGICRVRLRVASQVSHKYEKRSYLVCTFGT